MGFLTAVGSCFRKYFTFSGRASRAEYWWWTLFLFLGSFVYALAMMSTFTSLALIDLETFTTAEVLRVIGVASAFWLLTAIPTLTVTVRRLHDTGRSGGWILVPGLLNALTFWGALISMPAELSALGLKGVDGDPMLGTALMLGGSVGLLIMSIMMLVWMLKRGTRGENFFGLDPYDGGESYGEEYTRSYVPEVNRAAPAGAAEMNHREQISAIYQQRVLGKQGPGA